MTFYERLNELCSIKGVKLTPLLKELGISTGSTGRWKSGIMPGSESLLLLADYFNTSIDYLLCRTNDPKPPAEISKKLIINDDQLIEIVASESDEAAVNLNPEDVAELLEMLEERRSKH